MSTPHQHHNLQRVAPITDFVSDRALYLDDQAQLLTHQLREATAAADTIDDVIVNLVWLTPGQKAEANALLERHDYRALGKMLCAVHEQLVGESAIKALARQVTLWDEVL